MKLPKLLKKTKELLSDQKDDDVHRKKCLKEIQRKLKKKSKHLKEKMKSEQDEAVKQSISKDLVVISAQRKKVINELQIIKQKKNST